MRCLKRNRRTIHYALYQGKRARKDTEGHNTGEKDPVYSTPAALKISVSAGRGEAELALFGASTNFTRTLVTDDMRCPLDVNSLLWIDADPEGPHDYVMAAPPAKSINTIVYAIREVSVRA